MPKPKGKDTQALQQAIAAHSQGSLILAEQHGLAALKADRNSFDALALLGIVAAQQSRHEDACRLFRRALKIKPDNAQAHYDLGRALGALNRFAEAIASYRRAVAIQPGHAHALTHLAIALSATNRRQEADAAYQRALTIRREALVRQPGDFPTHYHLGKDFEQFGDLRTALACCREALALNPESAAARGTVVMYQLPSVFDEDQSVAAARIAFERGLSELDDWLESRKPIDGYAAFDNVRVFFLAYQEEDNLALLSRYGDLCARTLGRWQEEQGLAMRGTARGAKIRLGIVLAKVMRDSVWNAIVKSWVEFLDRSRFEVHLFQLEPRYDEETDFAISHTMHVDMTGKNLRESVDIILARELDVLIYPEFAMHPKPAVLAGLRLAPVQAASWGHPETTGMPTIDYFLSAEDLEPPGAQKHYRERLVLFPRLGCRCQRPAVTPVAPDLEQLGIASDRPLLLCAGSPFKYAPQFDWVLVEMARQLGRCQLVFFVYQKSYQTEKLRKRLDAVFARHGLSLGDYSAFIPWQPLPEYYGLLGRADVHLDTIGFSGFNTAMHSIECGLPVVTREGRFLRGRLASGILKRLGLSELVAATEQEYVALAVKLATDPAYRQHIHRCIEASRDALFDDVAPIRALETFCEDALRRLSPAGA